MKVMIVDDNKGMRQVIRSMLAAPRVEFCECADGRDVVSQYRKFLPDWVLMDVSMEYMDGISAAGELKAVFPDSKVVILTDYANEDLRARAKDVGAAAYVLKENLQEVPVLINSILQ